MKYDEDGHQLPKLTVRKLAELLAQIPAQHQNEDIYASYDGDCLTGLYEFDPATVGEAAIGRDSERYVVIPGD